ncbi:MAG: hypothetical protein J6Y48_04235, partial [Clostridia bacterium]|nr:hypothetical protein [Clostridia bacterium]
HGFNIIGGKACFADSGKDTVDNPFNLFLKRDVRYSRDGSFLNNLYLFIDNTNFDSCSADINTNPDPLISCLLLIICIIL